MASCPTQLTKQCKASLAVATYTLHWRILQLGSDHWHCDAGGAVKLTPLFPHRSAICFPLMFIHFIDSYHWFHTHHFIWASVSDHKRAVSSAHTGFFAKLSPPAIGRWFIVYYQMIWSSHLRKDVEVFERTLKRFTTIVPGRRDFSSKVRLGRLSMFSLEQGGLRGD